MSAHIELRVNELRAVETLRLWYNLPLPGNDTLNYYYRNIKKWVWRGPSTSMFVGVLKFAIIYLPDMFRRL